MHILLSNDDGVNAPGLVALAEALSAIAEVTVVAPDGERSAFSSALTLDRPLRPQRLTNGFIALNGTPADCVHIALNCLMSSPPDLVVSGINNGPNLGDDVIYSGTVAAALEGRFLGRPAMAVSLAKPKHDIHGIDDYRAAASHVVDLIGQWSSLSMPARSVLNVNIPAGDKDSHKVIEVTRLGHRAQSQDVREFKDPRGQSVYWIGALGSPLDEAPGTDFHAIAQGHVSVTPINPDMTGYAVMDDVRQWIQAIKP